jgi:hypothetical protein
MCGYRRGATWRWAVIVLRRCCSRGVVEIPCRLQSAMKVRVRTILLVSATRRTSSTFLLSLKRLRIGFRATRILALSDLVPIFLTIVLGKYGRSFLLCVRVNGVGVGIGFLGTKGGTSSRSRMLGYWGCEESGDRGRFRALIKAEGIVRKYEWGDGYDRLSMDV